MPDLRRGFHDRGALTRRGSGRTGRRAMWLLGVAAVVLVATPLPAGPPPSLPPEQAFEDYPGYDMWRFVSVEFSKNGGETATVRLVHPDGSVVAVLHYRLLSSTVFEAPVERSR